ncbi:MAG: glucoamylase family protein, partial [Candidatus Kaelpia imicola]|nr:glucoamylase family protein [Candidatus Kaelpia imicola]
NIIIGFRFNVEGYDTTSRGKTETFTHGKIETAAGFSLNDFNVSVKTTSVFGEDEERIARGIEIFKTVLGPLREWGTNRDYDIEFLKHIGRLVQNDELINIIGSFNNILPHTAELTWRVNTPFEFWNLIDEAITIELGKRAESLGGLTDAGIIEAMGSIQNEYLQRLLRIEILEDDILTHSINWGNLFDLEAFELLEISPELAMLPDELFQLSSDLSKDIAEAVSEIGLSMPIEEFLLQNLDIDGTTSYAEIMDNTSLDLLIKYAMILSLKGANPKRVLSPIIENAAEETSTEEEFAEALNTGLEREFSDLIWEDSTAWSQKESTLYPGHSKSEKTERLDSAINLVLVMLKLDQEDIETKIDTTIAQEEAKEELSKFWSYEPFSENTIGNNNVLIYVDFDGLTEALPDLESRYGNFAVEYALQVLLEGTLQRKLDLKSYKDVIALNYIKELYRQGTYSDISEIASEFKARVKPLQNLSSDFRRQLIEQLTTMAGDDYSAALEDLNAADWYWKELGLSPVDVIATTILSGTIIKELQESTLHQESAILLNNKMIRPYLDYYLWYLPNSGATFEEVTRTTLGKNKLLDYLFRDAVSGSYALTGASGSSFWAEAEGNPYTAEEIKEMGILSWAIKQLMKELLGVPREETDTYQTPEDVLGQVTDWLLRYFTENQDLSTGAIADAFGGIDNSMGVGGFMVLALISGVEEGKISTEKANQIIANFIDFIYDNPNDPNDLNAQGKFGLLYHYYRPGTDGRSGNCEVSLIDTYLTMCGFEAYSTWEGRDEDIVEKYNTFKSSIRLNELMFASSLGSTANITELSTLALGWTDERGYPVGNGVDWYHEYIIPFLMGIGSFVTAGDQEAADALIEGFYSMQRPVASGASGKDIVYPFDGALFQIQYPQVFFPLLYLTDLPQNTSNEKAAGYTGMNHYQNAIQMALNTHATAVQNTDLRSLSSYLWTLSASMGLDKFYLMEIGTQPRDHDGDNYDGTTSFNSNVANSMFTPWLSYQSMRYYTLAFPDNVGRYGPTDSINPEWGWETPTWFSLGGVMIAVENALKFGTGEGDSPWDLMLKNRDYLATLFAAGFNIDLRNSSIIEEVDLYQAFLNGEGSLAQLNDSLKARAPHLEDIITACQESDSSEIERLFRE